MALLWALVMKLGLWVEGISYMTGLALALMGRAGILINLVLMILNLIPLPPLDGSRFIASLLPPRMAYQYSMLEPYGFFILLALLLSGILVKIIAPPIYMLYALIRMLFNLP
jgi:Zn-dependent protease